MGKYEAIAKKYTTNKGVVLQLKPVSSHILMAAMDNDPPPEPPKFQRDNGRWETNDQDPDYLKAVTRYNIKAGLQTMTICMVMGTEVVSVPEGVPALESDWDEDFDALGLAPVKSGGRARKGTWLRFIILDDEEINDLVNKISAVSGRVTQEEAAEAAESFPSDEARAADTGSQPTVLAEHRNPVSPVVS